MAAIDWVSFAMDAQDETFFKVLGARLKEARRAQGMTQVELAEKLGIAQQTLAHYEVGRLRVPISLLPVLAQTLRLTFDEILIGRQLGRSAGKRGPASRLEQQIEAVNRLPKSKQRFVVDMIDAVLAQSQSV